MPSLPKPLRTKLETAVKEARRLAEAGARAALAALGVAESEPAGFLTPEQRALRVRLRAHARQLGDVLVGKVQHTRRLEHEVAYEHWHRMLFARFLAENGLLIEPTEQMAVSLEEAGELAEAEGMDLWAWAARCAQGMLPAVFRTDDPSLALELPQEHRGKMEEILAKLDPATFLATDALGWTYQFWQADKKEAVNKAGDKIGADEISAVTQLFTEDYMVDFLLDNTLGAWWAGKGLRKDDGRLMIAETEAEARLAVALPGCPWNYLRFTRRVGVSPTSEINLEEGGQDAHAPWVPAAGTFDGWPKFVKELKCLDPCMGSGHFIVALFERLVAMRMAEENLAEAAAQDAVIRENLFGLELDPRCTQIAAFNLALVAWRRTGYRVLPAMQLACSGLAPQATKDDWLAFASRISEDSPLAADRDFFGPQGQPMLLDARLASGMGQLYDLFEKAPVLGSLINPRAGDDKDDWFVTKFHELQPLLEKALAQETKDETAHELAVTASGLAKAGEILAGKFNLVATNVPYLGRGKQDEVLKDFCARFYPEAKNDLATCFIERCLELCCLGGTTTLVAPQNWIFLGSYRKLREKLLRSATWNSVVKLGAKAFQTPMWDFNIGLTSMTSQAPTQNCNIVGLDVAEKKTHEEKAWGMLSQNLVQVLQSDQLQNPDARIVIGENIQGSLLNEFACSYWGQGTGDFPRFGRCFWEIGEINKLWSPVQSTIKSSREFGGCELIVLWEEGTGTLMRLAAELRQIEGNSGIRPTRGAEAWGKRGVCVSLMGQLLVTRYEGHIFDGNCAAVVPKSAENLAAIWAFCSSPDYNDSVRAIDQKLNVTNHTLLKVPFDLPHWQKIAAEKYPDGLPKPFSSDPTQWLFNGHPKGSDQPLHVAVARLLGYQWPRQTGSSFPDCPALGPDGLEALADEDGIVCCTPLQGEEGAADRLRNLLAAAYGSDWSPDVESSLLTAQGCAGWSLAEWLRDKFFESHCALFHNRPFVWHLWDGHPKGFACLVNYHQLAAPNGGGRRTLEKLTYTYLGDWITRQKAAKEAGEAGADDRLAAAMELKKRLEAILHGEPPYDLFIRWKPLHQQPIGWDPDINDGVRLNIRPFLASDLPGGKKGAGILRARPKSVKWEKDRGKEPTRKKEEFPWFWGWDEKTPDFPGGKEFDGNRWNDLHYSRASKDAARSQQPS